MKHITITLIIVSISTIMLAHVTAATEKQKNPEQEIKGGYVPGMGEIMGATQMRHSKLWFAGNATNWKLASYELDEIREGLDDAVKYYPTFKNNAPVSVMLEKFTSQPLADLDRSIRAKDEISFKRSFNSLTNACNSCHQAAGMGFIVIKRPDVSPYSNQQFSGTTR